MSSPTGSTADRVIPTWVYLAALAIATLVSRLPQLLSPNLLLEGDECILGLMGMHVAQGRDFPLFFYGQRYGLSIVEAPSAALSFIIFGTGVVPLKIAMLAIWFAGIAFYFLAFARVLGTARSFWITLALVLMPAWAATSMKAWSGYLTAFSVTAVAFYLMTRNDTARSVPWPVVGVLTGIIYFSQPLWLPSLLPIVLFFLLSDRKLSDWLAYGSGILSMVMVVTGIQRFWSAGSVESWLGPRAGNRHPLASVPWLLNQTRVNLTGSYYFGTAVHAGRVTTTVAYLWLGVLGLATVLQVYRVLTRRYLTWSHLLFASICLTLLANWVLLDWRDPRYVLALNVPLVFLAGVELFDLADRYRVPVRRWAPALAIVLMLEAVSMSEFASYSYLWWTNTRDSPSETQSIRKVIGYLRSRNVTHAFAMNALLQWPITFYSHETVVARWKPDRDRYPDYVNEVDRALNNNETVAIVGYVGYTYGLERMVSDPTAIVNVDGKYFVYIGADRDLLKKAGFEFPG